MSERPRILIVDDDPGARETAHMLLLTEGYEILFATSGLEAIAALPDVQPDVILLDVMMPGVDGFEVCRRLKATDAWKHIPIILVTALDSKENMVRGLEAGADDFVNKPINKLELRARVRSMLRIKARHDDMVKILHLREDLSRMLMHDIRTPLTAMLIYCDLLEKEPLSEKQNRFLDTLRNQAIRMNSFLTDMLLMAKMEQGKLLLNQVWVDVRDLVAAAYRSFLPLAESRKLTFVLDLPENSLRQYLDANLWQRLLDNLISNALKFSLANGAVTLRLTAPVSNYEGTHFLLQIIDEGPGIPPAYRETIFDQFEIVASGQRDVTQVGLGLAFCKMVVQAHRGRIYVTANEPRGAIFNVEV
ncbi:MAG: response regulator [Chloroflexi bacterium]|nr:response regulator [Chloroflexota bacterium]MBP8057626.1 response regulator [Chloroflexota bacterium]